MKNGMRSVLRKKRLDYQKEKIFELLLLIFLFIFSMSAEAQEKKRWLLGTGITYCSYIDNPGLNLNVTYRAFRNLHLGPDFSALLSREQEGSGTYAKRKEIEYNFNAQYLFEMGKRWSIYPLVGLNWSQITNHNEGQIPNKQLITAINTGGGVEIKIKQFKLFAESKYATRLKKYDISTGILFAVKWKKSKA